MKDFYIFDRAVNPPYRGVSDLLNVSLYFTETPQQAAVQYAKDVDRDFPEEQVKDNPLRLEVRDENGNLAWRGRVTAEIRYQTEDAK